MSETMIWTCFMWQDGGNPHSFAAASEQSMRTELERILRIDHQFTDLDAMIEKIDEEGGTIYWERTTVLT